MNDPVSKRFWTLNESGLLGVDIDLNRDLDFVGETGTLFGHFEDVYLRFPAGSFALYGPNGIGKSRVLRALKEALGYEDERDHQTTLFSINSEDSFGSDHYKQKASEYLQNRRQRWGPAPAPLPADVANGIAADGLLCTRRDPGKARPVYAYGVAQDSSHPAVRSAVANLLEQIRKPFDDPDYLLEQYPDVVELVGQWWGEMGLYPEEFEFPKEGESWVDHPEIRDLLKGMTWRDYVQVTEERGLDPQRLCSDDERLTDQWHDFGRFVEIDRPAWAPWPLEWMVEEYSSDYPAPPSPVTVLDVDELTAEPTDIFAGLPLSETKGWVHDKETTATVLTGLASDILARLLQHPPRLSTGIDTYSQKENESGEKEWTVGTAPVWNVFDPYSDLYTEGIDHLSPTQRRWTRLALVLAKMIKNPGGGSVVVFCDEPEMGLPPQAQRHLSRGLSSISDDFGVTFIIATHSGAVLADPRFSLVKVQRGPDRDGRKNSRVALAEIDSGERSRLARAGVPVSEMLYLYRVILLVEGLHDLWVLDELIGAELDNAGVKVVPVHGAKQAASLFASEAGLLFEHVPDAKFVIAVDGTKQELLAEMLATVQQDHHNQDCLGELDRLVHSGEPSEEAKVMHTLLRRAVETDRIDDIGGLFGFVERDIIEYLNPEGFGLDRTWPELRSEHQERLENKKNTPRDFKRWLELTRDASFDEVTIRLAAPHSPVPAEVLELLELCKNAGRDS